MRASNKLSPVKVQALKKPGRYADGGGLYLQISQWGTKAWLFRYMLAGRARQMGLGDVSTFTLKEARERARTARQQLADGIDPIEARRQTREAARADTARNAPFKAQAEEFIAVHESTWRNGKHRQQWRNTLEAYAYPKIGDRPIAAVTNALVNETLAHMWTAKPETASRVHQRIRRIAKWVEDGKPLPKPSKTRRVRHHPALPYADMPEFMAELRARDSISARALEFTILTVARTGEALGARWREIDLEAKLWTIPAERMKGRREHIVPLSERAVELLRALPRERGSPHVFPGARKGRPLSDMAMLQMVRGMEGRTDLTVHGFRSSFRDWAGDRTKYARDVVEAALAHTLKDKTEAAYRRASAVEKRRSLMADWSRYCAAAPSAGKVVPLREARR